MVEVGGGCWELISAVKEDHFSQNNWILRKMHFLNRVVSMFWSSYIKQAFLLASLTSIWHLWLDFIRWYKHIFREYFIVFSFIWFIINLWRIIFARSQLVRSSSVQFTSNHINCRRFFSNLNFFSLQKWNFIFKIINELKKQGK